MPNLINGFAIPPTKFSGLRPAQPGEKPGNGEAWVLVPPLPEDEGGLPDRFIASGKDAERALQVYQEVKALFDTLLEEHGNQIDTTTELGRFQVTANRRTGGYQIIHIIPSSDSSALHRIVQVDKTGVALAQHSEEAPKLDTNGRKPRISLPIQPPTNEELLKWLQSLDKRLKI